MPIGTWRRPSHNIPIITRTLTTMRTIISVSVALAAILAVSASPALAQKKIKVNANANANSSSSSNSGAVAIGGAGTATAQGGNSSIVFNSPGQTSTVSRVKQSGSLKTTANAIAPGLGSAAVETCYGPGVSAGVGFTGGAFSFGMGQYDDECNLRLWARTAYAMGQRDLAGAILAQSPIINKAMQILDQQRGVNGAVVYAPRGAAPVYRTSAGGGACGKWSGGATGVGTCLWYN